ncbi:MAG: glycosyltransferase, partial [Gemmatimonadales bacterium]
MAETRALPSAMAQDAYEVLTDHDPTGTIASVRNGLAAKAKGEWLLHLDADDELGPGYIQAMQRAYEQRRRTDGVPPLLTPAVSYVVKGRRQMPRFLPGTDLTKNNYLVVGTLVERNLFLSVGGFSDYPHGFEDWSLWAKCWKAGAKIIQVRRAVYIAYINPDS